MLVISSIILGLVALAFLFQEGLGGLVDKEKAMSYFATIRDSPWSPLILTGVFLVASVTGISLNVLADVTQTAVRQPDAWNLGLFALVTAAFIGAVWFVRRALRKRGMTGEEE